MFYINLFHFLTINLINPLVKGSINSIKPQLNIIFKINSSIGAHSGIRIRCIVDVTNVHHYSEVTVSVTTTKKVIVIHPPPMTNKAVRR